MGDIDIEDSSANIHAQIRQRTLEQLPASHACVICLDQIHEPCEASPCHHTNFDYLCLVEWLSRTPRCPLCVQSVTVVKHQVDGKQVETPVRSLAKAEQKPMTTSTPTQNDLFLNPYRLRDVQRRNRPRRPRPCAQPSADLGIQGRRRVYEQGLYSKHVGTNRMSKYRELSPALFNNDTQLVSRARMFLRRELQVFPFLTGESEVDATDPASTSARRRRADNAEFLLEYIVAVLKSVDIMGGRAEDLVSEFLGREHTRLFLHELRAWLRSPYERLEDWDRMVQYGEPTEASRAAPPTFGAARQHPGREWQRPRGDSWRPSVRDRRKRESRRRNRPRASSGPGQS
ncbi:ring finger domain-containing protein [Sarocladium implicatum]|nr:ring finger domain-containing protein [Sarocladium implicatum]